RPPGGAALRQALRDLQVGPRAARGRWHLRRGRRGTRDHGVVVAASGYRLWRFYALWIVGLTLADQVTKALVIRYIAEYERIVVIPGFFNLVHIYNLGSAFGMFQ